LRSPTKMDIEGRSFRTVTQRDTHVHGPKKAFYGRRIRGMQKGSAFLSRPRFRGQRARPLPTRDQSRRSRRYHFRSEKENQGRRDAVRRERCRPSSVTGRLLYYTQWGGGSEPDGGRGALDRRPFVDTKLQSCKIWSSGLRADTAVGPKAKSPLARTLGRGRRGGDQNRAFVDGTNAPKEKDCGGTGLSVESSVGLDGAGFRPQFHS